MEKYKMTSEHKTMPCGTKVYRIEALIDIPIWKVKKGQIGGFVESEINLINSDKDECWVGDDAVVMGKGTRLDEKVHVKGTATVSGGSVLQGSISVYGNPELEDVALKGWNINVSGSARLYDVVLKGDGIHVSDNANLYKVRTKFKLNDSRITGNVLIEGSDPLVLDGNQIVIEENVRIVGGGAVSGHNIYITGDVELDSGVRLEGRNIRLEDAVHLGGDVRLGDNCHIRDCVSIVENTVSFDPVLKDLEMSGDLQLHVGEIYEMNKNR